MKSFFTKPKRVLAAQLTHDMVIGLVPLPQCIRHQHAHRYIMLSEDGVPMFDWNGDVIPVRMTEWVVRWPDHRQEVLSDFEFNARFQEAP